MIPMLDLVAEVKEIWPEIQEAIEGVVKTTEFINGPAVGKFEKEASHYLGISHCVGLNSGTDALVIGLRACGIKAGDEVITTPFTFFATAESISAIGAQPVLIDIEPDTYNIDPAKIEAKITKRTKAIMPVHLFGHACDMNKIMAIAKKHDLLLIEDTAQAFGGTFEGKQLGTLGDIGAYSFFPSKNLGAFGDGGLLVTADEKKASLSRALRNHGGLNKYKNEYLGYNSRLDSIQAAVLSVKLRHLDGYTKLRREVAKIYNGLLSDLPGVHCPVERPYANHVYHQYTLRIEGGRRDRVHQALTDAGITSIVYYPIPVHKLPVYAGMQVSLPIAERASEEVLSLPIGPTLQKATQEKIATVVRSALK
jgi:dTDP-4-amino-4,6-dideoxygalactose transaminase